MLDGSVLPELMDSCLGIACRRGGGGPAYPAADADEPEVPEAAADASRAVLLDETDEDSELPASVNASGSLIVSSSRAALCRDNLWVASR